MNVRTRWCSHLRLEQADRAEDAGRRRHEHGRDPERARHLGGEERPVAAEGDQDELARVAPALDGHRADRARHPRAAEQVDAVRGRLERRGRAGRATCSAIAARASVAIEARARSAAAPGGGSRGTTLASVSVASLPALPVAGRARASRPRSAARRGAAPRRRRGRCCRRPRRPRRCRWPGTRSRNPQPRLSRLPCDSAAADLELAGALDARRPRSTEALAVVPPMSMLIALRTADPPRQRRGRDHPGRRARLDHVDRAAAPARGGHHAAVRLHDQDRRARRRAAAAPSSRLPR